jgi:hypothetical protein
MMRKHFRFKSLVLGLAFGLAMAAFSASAVRAEPTSGYGPLDPWAYGLVHQGTQANVVAPAEYGPLDPWAYAVIHRSSSGSIVPPDVRDHRLVAQLVAQSSGSAAESTGEGFNWGDAGIGASVSFGAVLLLLTAVTLGWRYRRRIDLVGLATDAAAADAP